MMSINKFMLIFLLLASGSLIAGNAVNYQVKSHEMTVRGTSNLQSWTAEVEKLSGQFGLQISDGKIISVQNASLRVDATSIKGSEGRRMDDKINESLAVNRHPQISFVMRELLSLNENPGTARIHTRGVLTIAGVSRNIELHAVGRILPGGDIEFSGSQSLNMTDFQIKPPTAMFGALRTGEEISLDFRLVVSSR